MPTDSLDPDPHDLGPGLLPTPFSADEVRAGCPAGRMIRLRIESAGAPDVLRGSRYVRVDADGAQIEDSTSTEAGEPLGETRSHWATWRELQEHAAFPEASTVASDVELALPFGVLECRLYTMTEGETVHRFWFAAAHPGMPVRYSTEEAGVLVSQLTMESDTLESYPDSSGRILG
jgi:hypothetical protein